MENRYACTNTNYKTVSTGLIFVIQSFHDFKISLCSHHSDPVIFMNKLTLSPTRNCGINAKEYATVFIG